MEREGWVFGENKIVNSKKIKKEGFRKNGRKGTCINVCTCMCVLPACMYICMSAYMHVYGSIYVYMFVYICMYVRLYVCMHACAHACIYIRFINQILELRTKQKKNIKIKGKRNQQVFFPNNKKIPQKKDSVKGTMSSLRFPSICSWCLWFPGSKDAFIRCKSNVGFIRQLQILFSSVLWFRCNLYGDVFCCRL